MLLSFFALCGIIVIPVLPPFEESTEIDGYLTPLLCQPEETIERDQYSERARGGGTSYSMDVYCIDKDGDRRNETGRWALLGGGGFTIPFLIGLFVLIAGTNRSARNSAPTLMTTGTPVNFGTPSNYGTSASFGSSPAPSAGRTLSERLKQIDDARNQGLITADEYDRLRKEILDEM